MEQLAKLIFDNPKIAVVGAVLGTISAVIGWSHELLLAVVFVIFADTLTGSLVAWKDGKFASGVNGFGRIFLKIGGYFAITLLAVALGIGAKELNAPEWADWITTNAVAVLILMNEGLSILENAGKLGVPIPEGIKQKLEQLKQK